MHKPCPAPYPQGVALTVTMGAQPQKGKCPSLPRLLSGCGGTLETSPCPTSQMHGGFCFDTGAWDNKGSRHCLSHSYSYTSYDHLCVIL